MQMRSFFLVYYIHTLEIPARITQIINDFLNLKRHENAN